MSINFSNTTPAPPAGDVNVTWQTDGSGNVSAYVNLNLSQSLNPTLTSDYGLGYPQTLVTPSAPAVYRISWSQAIVIAGSVSSTFPSLTLAWSDVGGIARTATLVATSNTNTTAVETEGDIIIYTNGSTSVTVTSASYASYGATPMTYALAVVVEQL